MKGTKFFCNFFYMKTSKIYFCSNFCLNLILSNRKTPLNSGFFAKFTRFAVSRETDVTILLFHVKLIIYG